MAKLIPDQIASSTKSGAERRLFELFRDDAGTATWTVLHSLNLTKRKNKLFGEIDFVVLIPGVGVLCLEVKGGRIACKNGEWSSTNQAGTLNRLKENPFDQVRSEVFGLRDKLLERADDRDQLAQIPIDGAVVCPDVTWSTDGEAGAYANKVIDAKDLANSISDAVMRIVRVSELLGKSNQNKRKPKTQEIDSIAKMLRPDFELDISLRDQIQLGEQKVFAFTKEQEKTLQGLRANSRCLVTGMAGTGKSVLAATYAKEEIEQGKTVLLVCFNYLLAEHLKTQCKNTEIVVGNLHDIIRKLVQKSSYAKEFKEQEQKQDDATMFNTVFPYYGQLAIEECECKFDVLVVDEMQDLLAEPFLDFLDQALVDGLAGGNWRMFGDFNRQTIFGPRIDPEEALGPFCDNFSQYELRTNCRNSRDIADATQILTGFEMPESTLDQQTGIEVQYHYWSKPETFQEKMDSIVRDLFKGSVKKSHITILGPRKYENSSLAQISQVGDSQIMFYEHKAPFENEGIKYSSVQAYKGMENRVVILIDFDFTDEEYDGNLLYIGMSRARGMLIHVVNERYRVEVDRRLKAGMNELEG